MTESRKRNDDDLAPGCLLCGGPSYRRGHADLVVCSGATAYGTGNRGAVESGIVSEGSVHVRLSVKFYLVAMFFVVFDLEAVFIFLWAVAGRELGWAGYTEVLIFIGVLTATLAYLWRTGALDWYPAGPRARGEL